MAPLCGDVTVPLSLLVFWIGILVVPALLLGSKAVSERIYRYAGVRTAHILMLFGGVISVLITLRSIDALPCF